MTIISLLELNLENFKGIKKFSIQSDGGNIFIRGDNGTGKTTLYDAFTWLLFNKDSSGRADFNIKTLKPDGSPIYNLEHSVEAILDLDGTQIKLKKIFKEKWIKKRGSSSHEFSGHTTLYYIDDVPVKKKEYEEKINEIIDEELFKLLTSPTYFPSLHWQKRREIILNVCGNIENEEVFKVNPELESLKESLQKHSISNYKKILQEKQRKINKELETIPVRIDELSKTINEVNVNESELSLLKRNVEKDIEELQKEKGLLENNNKDKLHEKTEKRIIEIKKRLFEIESEIKAKKNEAELKIKNLENEKEFLQNKCIKLKGEITDIEYEIEHLRKLYIEKANKKYQGSDTCFACGQLLPPEKIQENIERFEKEKNKELQEITEKGQKLKNRLEELKLEYEKSSKKLDETLKLLESEADLKIEYPSEYDNLKKELKELEESLKNNLSQSDNSKEIQKINDEIAKKKKFISEIEEKLAQIKQNKTIKQRIEELKKYEKKLASEWENIEREIYLCNEFIKTKVKLLEDKINSKFEEARFKLFEIQINGGVNEICDITYNGVPYSDLNHGAKINIGLDIIKTLQKHYNIYAPIWIDNRESITKIPEMPCQLIHLIVDANKKQLEVNYESKSTIAA